MPGAPAGTRRQSRERALSLLYEAEMKGLAPGAILAALPVPPDPYAAHLVEAVARDQVRIDALVGNAAVGWPLERMAVLDRLVLRLAVAELADPEGPPVAVVLDEAVELAKIYSTEESGRFVNGILATLAPQVRP